MTGFTTDNKEQILATLITNGFVSNPMGSIAMATMSGLGFMFIAIMINAPIFFSMIALFGGILLVYGYRVGKIEYSLFDSGIRMRIRRFIPYYLKKKEEERFIEWRNIKSFKNDTDKKRSGGDYEYLKLYLSQSPGEIWITDERDKSGFQSFLIAFKEIVRKEHEASVNKLVTADTAEPTPVLHSQKHLIEKRSFYKTNAAKALTIFFILVAIGLLVNNQIQGLSFRNLFRLELIIIPGISYMVYRVFIKQD